MVDGDPIDWYLVGGTLNLNWIWINTEEEEINYIFWALLAMEASVVTDHCNLAQIKVDLKGIFHNVEQSTHWVGSAAAVSFQFCNDQAKRVCNMAHDQ